MGDSPCARCDGVCCRTYSVELTVFDIRRLMDGLGAKPETFCTTVESWPGRCLIAPSTIESSEVNFVLRRTAAGACAFLRGGSAGCGVYEHRPRACAAYPYRLDADLPVERERTPCPVPWQDRVEERNFLRVLRRLQAEATVHNALVRRLDAASAGDDGLFPYVHRLLFALAVHV